MLGSNRWPVWVCLRIQMHPHPTEGAEDMQDKHCDHEW